MIRIDLASNLRPSRDVLPRLGPVVAALVALAVVLGTGARAIEGGTDAKKDEFPFVYALNFTKTAEGGDFVASCTGVLVHPRLILTAAHSFENGSRLSGLSSRSSVDAGSSGDVDWSDFKAHPDYGTHPDLPEGARAADLAKYAPIDIAWVRLPKDRGGPIARIRMLGTDDERAALLQDDVTLVGYGSDRFNPSDLRSFAGAGSKRWSRQHVTSYQYGLFRIEQPKGNVLSGDSGGPLLRAHGDGFEVLGLAHSFIPRFRMVPDLKKNGKQRKTLFGKPKFKKDIFYSESNWLGFTETNLCWVQQTSGIDLGVSCPAARTSAYADVP
jgi:V8-like Glu-specific endopeptidase